MPVRAAHAEEARLPVAFVVTQSENCANGGVESITEVLERLRRVKPLVVTQMETEASRRWRDAGSEVRVWPMRAPRLSSLLSANLRMFRLINSTGCRVVHCNDILALWHTSFGARMAGASVVFNVRNIKPEGQRYGWRWRVARRVSNRQLVLSKEMRTALARRLGLKDSSASARADNIEYIYSAVDSLRLSPVGATERAALRERFGISARDFAVGFVAAFEPRKAQLDFIREAAPRLRKSLARARVFFVGDFAPDRDDYARECLAAVEELGLEESVSFVGYTPGIAEWYRALDLVVVASRNEGLARCMIESLACGTPVVSFDVCSAREILEAGECGVVVPSRNYELLAERITALAEQADVRRRLGGRGVAVARELFDPLEVVSRYERLYFSLAEG
ncbi:MAG TPA: glycosyltransferase family 4 protein [Pyrinomonadaceae bacterium]|nr:glycosyltransferase family 4 protein [Pyrinomonadaceae bacterium]